MRDWLALIIVVLIVVILVDGVRRMRLARKQELKLSRNAAKADKVDVGDAGVSTSEFPSGKARVAKQRDPKSANALNRTVKQKFEQGKVTAGSSQRIPEQVALNLEESVPMLMDSVEYEEDDEAQDSLVDDADYSSAESTPLKGASVEGDENTEFNTTEHEAPSSADANLNVEAVANIEANNNVEPSLGAMDALYDEIENANNSVNGSFSDTGIGVDELERDLDSGSEKHAAIKADSAGDTYAEETAEEEYVDPDLVLIINVMAHKGELFDGGALLDVLTDLNLKLGAMEIFHRYLDNDGDGPILYSMANMVVPGTFNLSEMNEFQTPGISLFLSLPVKSSSLEAYDDMVLTAKTLAERLDGELKDENRSVMTNQTIEYARQSVIEYERKKKLTHA